MFAAECRFREKLTAKAMSEVSDKAVGCASSKVRMPVKLPALFENRSKMEQRHGHSPCGGRGHAGMNHQWGSVAVESGVEQVNIWQHHDQHDNRQRAEQNYPGKRTELSMAHNT